MKNGYKKIILIITCLVMGATFSYLYFKSNVVEDCCSKGVIPLERFSIKNKKLESISYKLRSELKVDSIKEIQVIEFIYNDSVKMYYISFQEKKNLMSDYVCWKNRRIIGYALINNSPAILLSNVNHHWEFLNLFSDDLEMDDVVNTFDYMHYPTYRYKWKNHEGKTLTWRDKRILYNPLFAVIYQNKLLEITNTPEAINRDYVNMLTNVNSCKNY